MAAQQKALILLIHDQSTQLLLWQQQTLTILAEYRNAQEDSEGFKAELAKYPEHRILLVTDVIDENFRHDVIVHVTGADREALIKRKLDFSFRTTRYRLGRVNGRESEGRKQDKLLLAAISKPELLDGWVESLIEEKRAIQSITSTAWLLGSYLPLKKLDKEPTLLVIGVDPGNNLRQSFFQEGKLLFSRQTNLVARNAGALVAEIESETMQVRQYLERIQFVQYESALRILVMSVLAERDLPLSAVASGSNRFEQHRANDDLGKITLVPNGRELIPNHYLLAKVLAAGTPPNFYGPPSATRYHDLLRLGSMINMAAGVVLLGAIGWNINLGLGVNNKITQADSFEARKQPEDRKYAELSKELPVTELPTAEMALIVTAYSRVKSQTLSPIPAINRVAQALAQTKGVRLSKLQWTLEANSATSDKDAAGKDKNRAPAKDKKKPQVVFPGLSGDNLLTGEILLQNTQIKLIISGEATSANSFREAQEEVTKMIEALRAIPGVKVFASKMPVDVRTDIQVSFTVDDRDVQGQFILEVTMAIDSPSDQPAKVALQP